MSNLNSKFKEILKDLEKNVQNKNDLEYIKIQMFNLYNLFFNEVIQVEGSTNERISTIATTLTILQERVDKLENKIKLMGQEVYPDECSDFIITCPYCTNEFILDGKELKDEVECPKCNNIIELDWSHKYNRTRYKRQTEIIKIQ